MCKRNCRLRRPGRLLGRPERLLGHVPVASVPDRAPVLQEYRLRRLVRHAYDVGKLTRNVSVLDYENDGALDPPAPSRSGVAEKRAMRPPARRAASTVLQDDCQPVSGEAQKLVKLLDRADLPTRNVSDHRDNPSTESVTHRVPRSGETPRRDPSGMITGCRGGR